MTLVVLGLDQLPAPVLQAETDPQEADESTDEEAAFWRGFVEWWAREKQEPVPRRAWEALARAEEKQTEPSASCNEEGNG